MMAMYCCHDCQRVIDDDYDPMNDDECCGDCHAEREDMKMNASEFIQGQKDCRDGVPHESGKGESYDKGYSNQVWHNEQETARSML